MKDYILLIREDVPGIYHMTREEIDEIIHSFNGRLEDVTAHLLAEARKRDPDTPDMSEWIDIMLQPTACLEKRGVRLVLDGEKTTEKTLVMTIQQDPNASFFKRMRSWFMLTFFRKAVERSIRKDFLKELYKEGAITKETLESMSKNI